MAVLGRPTLYTEELAEKICNAIAENPHSVEQLYKMFDWFPSPRTVYQWLAEKETFSQRYARAKEAQVEVRQEQIVDLVTDDSNDYVIDERGRHITNTVKATRLRLHVEYYKWAAERLKSKKYANKTQTEMTFDDAALKKIKEKVDDASK